VTTAAEIVAFPLRRLEGARLSELARCPRMGALGAIGTQRADWRDIERRYLTRGRMYGKFVAEQLALRYPGGIEVEREIPWPHGTGHADVYIKPEKMIVEVVSTVTPSPQMLAFKMTQARLYLHFDPEAEHAQVYVIDPSSLMRDAALPVVLGDEDREQIEEWVADVGRAKETGDLPERVCRKPEDGRSHLCPFVEPCFEGWEPVPRGILDDPEIYELAQKHHLIAEQERVSRTAVSHLATERKEIEQKLADQLEPGEYEAADLVVRRTHVAAGERLSVAKVRAAGFGHLLDGPLGPFVTISGEHDRWKVERREGDALSANTYDWEDAEVPF
jgi:hypothetical protein